MLLRGGALAATGLGVSSTVLANNSHNQNESLVSQVVDLKAQLSALQTQFEVFPRSLDAATQTAQSSEALIHTLQRKVNQVIEDQQVAEQNAASANSKVQEFSSSFQKDKETVQSLQSSSQSIKGRLEEIGSQIAIHLAASAAASHAARGAEELATRGKQELNDMATKLTEDLSKQLEDKINKEFSEKKGSLETDATQKVDAVKKVFEDEKTKFVALVQERLKTVESGLQDINNYVWGAFLNLRSGVNTYKPGI